jgi:predicted aspartyl protease
MAKRRGKPKAKKWIDTIATVTVEVTVPVKVVSEANSREHWRVRHKRFTDQKEAVRLASAVASTSLKEAGSFVLNSGSAEVTLTRIGGRGLDSDNLAGAFKAVRDQIAEMMRVDDGHKDITWVYHQEASANAGISFSVVAVLKLWQG